tara:strand:+ start:53247 stop:54518 length:1272 start_codon:yes stop_codon:yes gene_type:complete
MQHSYFASQASTVSTEQSEAEQALLNIKNKFETLQADFEALHQEKKPTEQSQFYLDKFKTLEIKYDALKVICEHHKADLDKCLKQSSLPISANAESNHPMQRLNQRLQKRKALETENTTQDTAQYEYDDPAQYASPETTKPEQPPSSIEPEPQIESQPEITMPESQAKLESEPTLSEHQVQSKLEVTTPESQAVSKPEVTTPEPQVEPKPEVKAPEAQVQSKPEVTTPESQAESKPEVVIPEAQVQSKPEVTTPEPQVEPKPEVKAPEAQVQSKSEIITPEPKAEPETQAELSTENNTADTSASNLFQCPSAQAVNKGLITGNFKENNIVWWLDFSFRPLNQNEEVKAHYQTLFSGRFMDCYYRIGPQASEKIIEGIWIVMKGAAQGYNFEPSKDWQDCDFDGCLKMCLKKDGGACEFYLNKN